MGLTLLTNHFIENSIIVLLKASLILILQYTRIDNRGSLQSNHGIVGSNSK